MKTLLRLLAMAVTFAGLFVGTWTFLGRAEREGGPGPPPPPKAEELLIGTWELVEQDPPLGNEVKGTVEYARDGTITLRVTHPRDGTIPTSTGRYQLKGDTLRHDYFKDANNPHTTWLPKIGTLTEDRLILIGEGETKRVVLKRVDGK
jgi:hypothetical protein